MVYGQRIDHDTIPRTRPGTNVFTTQSRPVQRWRSTLVFGRCSGRVSAGTLADVFRDFPQSPQANIVIVRVFGYNRFLLNPFAFINILPSYAISCIYWQHRWLAHRLDHDIWYLLKWHINENMKQCVGNTYGWWQTRVIAKGSIYQGHSGMRCNFVKYIGLITSHTLKI